MMVDHHKRIKIPVPKNGSVDLFVMMMRKKDNDRLIFPTIYRRVVRHEEEDLKFLRALAKERGGTWRIYKTVNKRSLKKANKIFMHKLIDDYDKYYYRIDSLWKTCLLQKKSRAEKKFLVDIDDVSMLDEVMKTLKKFKVTVLMKPIRTPNGWHIVACPFDRSIFSELNNVEIGTDRLYLVEMIEGDGDE